MELAYSTISSCQFFKSKINSHSLSLSLCIVSRGIKTNFPSTEEDLTKGTQKKTNPSKLLEGDEDSKEEKISNNKMNMPFKG